MEEWFGIVVIVVSLVAIVVAVIALASSGRTFEQIGRGDLSLGEGGAMSRPAGSGLAPIDTAARDDEIRQMLGARNARRAARGEAPIDIEEELRALIAPPADPGLREEVRQLVEARNNRRVAKGQEPLDVDAEVSRRLRELGSSSS